MKITFKDIKKGDKLPPLTVKMDRERYLEYNELVSEINPLHFNRDYARSLGFKDIVVAGVYTYSFAPKMIDAWIGEPGRIANLEIKYIQPAYIEDEVTYRGVVKSKRTVEDLEVVECEVYSENSEGTRLLEASITAYL